MLLLLKAAESVDRGAYNVCGDEEQPTRTYRRKKKVNKGRWSKDEDEKLKDLALQYGTNNWKQIADNFPDRTDVQCLHRWQKVLNPELVKGPWTKEEDDKVVELVHKYGPKKWSLIAQQLKGRIGKQCRERWHNHLNPDINKEAWTEEEDRIIYDAHRRMGNKWAEIAKLIPGRTDNAIKNHWNSTMRRKVESAGYEHYKRTRYQTNEKKNGSKNSSLKRERKDADGYIHYPPSNMPAPAILPKSSSARSVTTAVWNGQNSQLTNIKPKGEAGLPSSITPQKTVSTTLGRSDPILSPFRTYIYPETLLESDPSTWGDVSTFEKTGDKPSPLSKLTSPGATGYRFDGNSLAGIQTEDGQLIPITSPVIQNRFSTPPTILRRGRKRKAQELDSTSANDESKCTSPKGNTPIKSLPFSPSQFLNSPVGTNKLLTSTPANAKSANTQNITLNTPSSKEAASSEDPYRTPRIRRNLLSMSPRTPTPFKNALKVLNDTKLAHTPAYLQEDFSEILKQEEEDSGMHVSSVRTSLEEKYRKAAMSQDPVTTALYNGEHSKVNGRLSDSTISNNTFLEDSGIAEASITKASQETSVVNPSDVFGKQSVFVTPSSLPCDVNGSRRRKRGVPMRILRVHETPVKASAQLDVGWEEVACGKTPDQQLLTEQAKKFIANYRPAARTLQFSTAAVV